MSAEAAAPGRRCALHATLGRIECCPGAACPFWDAQAVDCVLHEVEFEILCRPPLAQHLLDLRASLEAARPGGSPS